MVLETFTKKELCSCRSRASVTKRAERIQKKANEELMAYYTLTDQFLEKLSPKIMDIRVFSMFGEAENFKTLSVNSMQKRRDVVCREFGVW